MRIGIQTWGSTGDVNPFIALAAGLAGAGHDVTLALTSAERRSFTPVGERLGFRVMHVGHIGESEAALNEIGSRLFAIRNPMKQLPFIFDVMFDPSVPAMYEAARQLCADSDLIIGHFIAHPAQLAAEQAGRPYITVALNHGGIPTRSAPPAPLPNLGPWCNALLWKLTAGMLDRMVLPSANRLRGEQGSAALHSYRQVWESGLCNLIAVSRELCPRYADWSANHHVCGFFDMPEQADDWRMPEDLARFLEAGEAPVFIGFGSMTGLAVPNADLDGATRLMVESAQRAGCRAIIQSHWDAVSSMPESPGIYRIGPAPHALIFPRCAAIVHHAGAGTTQSSLRAGRPSVVVAHITDQFFWGDRLHRLGVAPPVIARRKATPARIANAIRKVLGSPTMRARAQEAGQRMRDENGVASAVGIIEQTFDSRR